MERTSSADREVDLEIISIGTLYAGGRWEKKYWSSSRGKCRYPYPVGYHASRTLVGTRCKMEIAEGPRGPMFMVGPSDGDLCTGLTPDLAWESFCKKTKNRQGRRSSSSKMDGTELFGFNNKIVQRLLRELVAASSRSLQRQISSSLDEQGSSSRTKSEETLQDHQHIGTTSLGNNQIDANPIVCSRKRSAKHKTKEKRSKREHHEFLVDDIEGPIGSRTTLNKCSKSSILADSQKENREHEESPFAHQGEDELETKTADFETVLVKHGISQENWSMLQNVHTQVENLLGISENEKDIFEFVPDSPDDMQRLVVQCTQADDLIINDASRYSMDHGPEKEDLTSSEYDGFLGFVPDSPVDTQSPVPEYTLEDDPIINDMLKDSTVNFTSQRTMDHAPVLEFVPDNPGDTQLLVVCTPENELIKEDLTRSMVEMDMPRVTRDDTSIEDVDVKAELKTEVMSKEESEQKTIGSSESSLVTKEGDNLQSDLGKDGFVFTDSFLASMEDEFQAIENAAMLKKSNNLETSKDPSRNLENLIGNVSSCCVNQGALSQSTICQKRDDMVELEKKLNSFEPVVNGTEFEVQVASKVPCSNANQFVDLSLDSSYENLTEIGLSKHPKPVLSLTLNSKDNYLEICVLSGDLNTYERTLHIYKMYTVVTQQPTFVGHVAMLIDSVVKPPFDDNFPLGRVGLQYISEEQLVVLVTSIKAPYCSKKQISCSCSICELEQGEENAIKIARVDFGFVVPVTKLKTNEKVSSILVCKHNYVIAVESTRLHVWNMTCRWSAISDQFTVPTLQNNVSSILDLGEVLDSNGLVIGHDGFGAFFLWDIPRRVLLAKCQSPNSTISKIIPFSNLNINREVVVWLLVCSCAGPQCQTDSEPKDRTWRLAHFDNDKLFMGKAMNPRVSVCDAYGDFGFVGCHEGFFFKYDLRTNKILACVDCFDHGGSVSLISVDSKSGAVAVVDNENNVILYMP